MDLFIKDDYTHEGVKAPLFEIRLNKDNTIALLWVATLVISVACINRGKK